jgi:hypothetical protein
MLERNHLIFKPLKPNTVQVFAGDPFQKLGVGGRPLRWILKGYPCELICASKTSERNSNLFIPWQRGKNSCPNFDPLTRQKTGHSLAVVEAKLLISTAVQIGLLTIYDMCTADDRGMTMTDVKVLEKHGGKSGSLVA